MNKGNRNGRDDNGVSLGQALKQAFGGGPLRARVEAAQVVAMAQDLLGPTVLGSISKIYFEAGKLWIHTASSPLRGELFLTRDMLRTKLNKGLGQEMVREVMVAG